MNRLNLFLWCAAILPATTGLAQANVTFSFTESGGTVSMQSSGVLNTANLVIVSPGIWGSAGIETNNSPESDIMGDTTMGDHDIAFGFHAGTDTSAWVGDMFLISNFDWVSSGTTQFTTYYDSPPSGRTPGIGISSADMIGALWMPDVSWKQAGTLEGLGLTSANYRITDIVSNESITIQILPVPEPKIYAMLLAGIGLVGWSARRRSKHNLS